jgi:type VI secretion system protein ImpH
MGAEERQSIPHLTDELAALEKDARRYSFFRLVYLLERIHDKAPPVGQLGPVADERIRLRADTSLTFSASDISAVSHVEYPDGIERTRVTNTFMGLYGAVSPLPMYYVEELAQSAYQGGPQPIREFFDIFHHRLLSLLYRTWTKYRFAMMYKKGGADPFTRRMLCCVGLDGFRGAGSSVNVGHGSASAGGLDRFLLLRYAPLLATQSRSARGLEVVLSDLFRTIGIRIEQFVGHWTRLEKPRRNRLGVMNHQIGETFTLGRYVYDGTGRFTLVLGPLDYDEYLSFLPNGSRRLLLLRVIATFTRGQHDVMLELHVKTDAAPRFQLGSPRAATLTRTSWLGGGSSQEFVLTVPLEDKPAKGPNDDDDDDRGEPPE